MSCGQNVAPVVGLTVATGMNLQASGTLNENSGVSHVDANDDTNHVFVEASTSVDIDALARDSTVGKFARIDVHGSTGTECTFWWMVIPSG